MKRGDRVTYVSLAGESHEARIVFPREDGTVDITVYAGSNRWLELSRIAIGTAGEPGTCKIEGGAQ